MAQRSGLSRSTWRAVVSGSNTVGLHTIAAAAGALSLESTLLVRPSETRSELSTIAVSYKVVRDGVESWKIHFMDLVDEFRRSLDPSLLFLAPPPELPDGLRALLAGIVVSLAEEVDMQPPSWTRKRWALANPWFVSESENLKATALLESPLAFRRYNIFVLDNFLTRV